MELSKQLVATYREIMTQSIESQVPDGGTEAFSMLHETGWVKIFLVRRVSSPEGATMEVEFSLPEFCLPMGDDTKLCKGHEVKSSSEAKQLIQYIIKHLRYLEELIDSGFKMEMFGGESIWTVSKSFLGLPDEDLFRKLIPPNL